MGRWMWVGGGVARAEKKARRWELRREQGSLELAELIILAPRVRGFMGCI